MPVSLTENATTALAALSSSCSGFQPPLASVARSETEPRSVNLKALESRFLSTCCSRLVSVWIAGGSAGSTSTSNSRPLRSATWRKVLLHEPPDLAERHRADIHRHGAGLDLRQVEDVVDEVEQVRAGAVDRLGEADLLGGEVAVRVLGQDLRENQQTVERRPELVRHVGQELRLVLGDEGELLGLFLQRHLGLLHFLVLRSTSAFWLDSSCAFSSSSALVCCSSSCCFRSSSSDFWSERVCCSSRLLVSVRASCCALEALGERLGLLEQLLGPHVGGDRVEHDADTLRQLVQEGEPDLVEPVEGRELDHGFDLALEQHRQDHDAPRRRLAQSRADLDVVARHAG